MQAHVQEEMFMGHNKVGKRLNPGNWWLKNILKCYQILNNYHKDRYATCNKLNSKLYTFDAVTEIFI